MNIQNLLNKYYEETIFFPFFLWFYLFTYSGAAEWEYTAPILSLCHGILQTNLFVLFLFFFERKAVPFLSHDWSWDAHRSLVLGIFNVKINYWSMKMLWQEYSAIVWSYSSAPDVYFGFREQNIGKSRFLSLSINEFLWLWVVSSTFE